MNKEFVDYCSELLASLGPIKMKRMFGGAGLYADDLIVALVISEQLFLKVDTTTKAEFEAAGCKPFTYEGKGKTVVVSYYEPPAEAMESPAFMQHWARLALQAALRAANAKLGKPQRAAVKSGPRKKKASQPV